MWTRRLVAVSVLSFVLGFWILVAVLVGVLTGY